MSPPVFSILKEIIFAKRLIVLKKFIFSEYISLATTIKHSLISLPLVSGSLCLANKWATPNFTMSADSFSPLLCFVEKKKKKNLLWRWNSLAAQGRIWCYHCSGLGSCCGAGLIPGLGTSACHEWSLKKEKKKNLL